ncbi:MAG: hypothetical protein PHI31_11795 [Desulfuromonadaceae bacterium]|nr:hypothetical protein [Desulfuromonadaceae bacterium]
MSYILDALKKIEHDKDKKRHDGKTGITGDLFRERNRPEVRGGGWKIIVLIVVVSLFTCAGTWFVTQGVNRTGSTAVHPQAVVPPAVAVAPPPAVKIAPTPTAVGSVPMVITSEPQKKAQIVADDVPARNVRRLSNRPAVPPASVAQKQVVLSVPAPADIKLSGIAWQDDRSSRRAVVNGFLLKEGAVVLGSRISEILADRVKFTSAAGVFEIRLDAVLPAEVKK